MSFRFYAVKRGRNAGVYESLQDVQEQADGVPSSKLIYRGCCSSAWLHTCRACCMSRNHVIVFQAFTIATKPNSGSLAARLRRRAAVACATLQARSSKPSPPPAVGRIMPRLLPRLLLLSPPRDFMQIQDYPSASPPPRTPRKTLPPSLLPLLCPAFGASWTPQVQSPIVAMRAPTRFSRPRPKRHNDADCSASVARRALEQYTSPHRAIDHMYQPSTPLQPLPPLLIACIINATVVPNALYHIRIHRVPFCFIARHCCSLRPCAHPCPTSFPSSPAAFAACECHRGM
jgi:hypothetical protein